MSLLAQTGSANVPDVTGGSFAQFDDVLLSETNDVILRGKLLEGVGGVSADNRTGVWNFAPNQTQLLVRTGVKMVAGVSNAEFSGFPAEPTATVAVADDGQVAFLGRLTSGVGGVTSTNNFGIWSYSTSGSELIAREDSQNVPGIVGTSFQSFALPAINANHQVASLATLKVGGQVSPISDTGIWLYDDNTGQLLARTGVGNVPGASSDFLNFASPHINDSGLVAFSAELLDNTEGVWAYTDGVGALVAAPSTVVPALPSAEFDEFEVKAINAAGQLLVDARLNTEVGGITADDAHGLWLLNGDDRLVARTGSGNVTDVPGANFANFSSVALNDRGQVAFTAELELGVASIDSTNDVGLWMVDPSGSSWLVAREGDLLAGRTITSLDFAGDDGRQSSGFNNSGEIAFQASFANGESGLFLFRPYAADFDRDGKVAAGDLTAWTTEYALSAAADANLDDDSDGTDFLAWQREFGNGTTTLPILSAIPEPASIGLLLIAIGTYSCGESRARGCCDRYKRQTC